MHPQLESLLEAVRLRPDDARTHFELGNVWASLGRHAESSDAFRRVIQLRPDVAAAYFNLANALLSLAQWQEAAQTLETCVRLEPSGESFENLAAAYVRCERLDAAIDALRKSLQHRPESLSAALRLASLLTAQEAYDEAKQLLEAAQRQTADHPQVRATWAQWHQSQGNVFGAIASWGEAIALAPEQAEWRCYQGALLQLVGRHDEARRVIEEGLNLQPDDPRLQGFLNACSSTKP